ncbi:hypothetical protein [Carnobacterium divergens]|nr:hypothetical protein [Carnobacterium divergens]
MKTTMTIVLALMQDFVFAMTYDMVNSGETPFSTKDFEIDS